MLDPFSFHVATALIFIAFGLGIAFIAWSFRNQGEGVKLVRVTGYIIAILAVLGYLCTLYYGVKYWSEGYYKTPTAYYSTQLRHGDK
ncbi:MAG: hypothetical protein H0U71_09685 [Gammaproteobacteria bacterium]|nr:hypothetical protein [Gammaproteobacteria bacterium]